MYGVNASRLYFIFFTTIDDKLRSIADDIILFTPDSTSPPIHTLHRTNSNSGHVGT